MKIKVAVGFTSENTSVPNGGSWTDVNIAEERGTGGHKRILVDGGTFVEDIHQSSMPRHCKFQINIRNIED